MRPKSSQGSNDLAILRNQLRDQDKKLDDLSNEIVKLKEQVSGLNLEDLKSILDIVKNIDVKT